MPKYFWQTGTPEKEGNYFAVVKEDGQKHETVHCGVFCTDVWVTEGMLARKKDVIKWHKIPVFREHDNQTPDPS